MKRLIRSLRFALPLAVLVLVAPGSPAFGQAFSSLLNQASFGLFGNALDAAASVLELGGEPTFSSLHAPYLFAGPSNLGSLAAGTDALGVPFTMGYYSDGPRPWSAMGSINVGSQASNTVDFVNPTMSSKSVGSTTYTWISSTDSLAYPLHEAWSVQTADAMIGRVGTTNLGAWANLTWNQNVSNPGTMSTWMGNNLTDTTTLFFDAAGAGVAPSPTVNYVQTISRSNPDTSLLAILRLPLWFDLGGAGLSMYPLLMLTTTDASHLYTVSYSAPQAAGAGGWANVTTLDRLDRVQSTLNAGVSGTLYLRSPIATSSRNAFLASLQAGASYAFNGPEVTALVVQDLTYAGSGAPVVPTNIGNTHDTMSTMTFEGRFGGYATPSVQHLIYVPLGDVTLAFGPSASCTVSAREPARPSSTTAVTKVDNDADGLFESAVDRITTVTTTHADNDLVLGYVGAGFSCPAAATFRPSGAPFGVTVGGTADIVYSGSWTTTQFVSTTSVTHVVDGTGATVGTDTTTEPAPGISTTSWTTGFRFRGGVKLDLTFFLPNGGTIDLLVNGTPGASLVTAQAVIPLP